MNNQNLEEKINPYESPKVFDIPEEKEYECGLIKFIGSIIHICPTFNRKISPHMALKDASFIEEVAYGSLLGGGLYIAVASLILENNKNSSLEPIIFALIPLTTNLISGAYELLRSKKHNK